MSATNPAELPRAIDEFLDRLNAELAKAGVSDRRAVAEAREHLRDAVQDALRRGLSPDTAAAEALARFGDAETIAAGLARIHDRLLHRLLLVTSVAIGVSIAIVDSQPHWDDAGLTAGALLLSAALLGVIGPRRPWAWALGVGVWIPMHSLVSTPSWNAAAMLVLLAIPMAGAYAGVALRRVFRAVS